MTVGTLTIDIYSDVVCPWCYVGKRRLQRALGALNPVGGLEISWRPFQLNPTMPVEGMDRTTYLEAKFGSLERFRQMEEHVVQAGTSEGIRFAFDKIARTANTFQAHRLIWHAKRAGCQDAVVDSLFRGYFEEGANIGDRSELARLAARGGLEPEVVESFLCSDEGTSEVKAEESAGHRLGIRGVPYFVVNGEYGISGAQPPDVFLRACRHALGQSPKVETGTTLR